MHSPSSHPLKFRQWADLRFSLLWAYEGPVLRQAHTGTYNSAEASCWLIRRGRVRISANGETLTARKNQWAFVAVPRRHQEFSADAEILSLHFRLVWPGAIPLFDQPSSTVFESARFPSLERAARNLVRQVRRAFPGAAFPFLPEQPCGIASYLSVQNLLPAWLTAYTETQAALGNDVRQPGAIDERIRKGLAELDRTPLDRRFSEPGMLRKAGLGRSQFNALFRAAMGMSPRAYFEARRKEEAAALMAYTNLSIKEIAARLGFRYDSHFTIWFRRHFQQPPSAYRERL